MGRLVGFGRFWKGRRSTLGRQIEATLCPRMVLPPELEQLFHWIETNGYFIDKPDGRLGFLFSEAEQRAGRTETGRPGGTDITFAPEGNVNLRYWFRSDDPDIMARLCVFAQTGHDGSMAAFWLADDGSQKIVHLGSGSGSVTLCVLADEPVDFLRLLAIGYDEICWGQEFGHPPNQGADFTVEQNRAYVEWVEETFNTTIPDRASEIVKHPHTMDTDASPDPFWQWVRQKVG